MSGSIATPAPDRAPRRSWAKRLGVALISLTLSLLLVEGLHRASLRGRGTPYDRVAVEAELRRGVDTTAAFVPANDANPSQREAAVGERGILHPFYASEKFHDTGGVLSFFREGGEREGVYTVVVLGGSVAANWSTEAGDAFAEQLEADPRFAGQDVQVLKFAHPSYKQPQQVTRLSYLLSLGYRPDAVINLDGFNETAVTLTNTLSGTHPLHPSPPVWGSLLKDREELDLGALDSLVELRRLRNQRAELAERALGSGLTASSVLGTWFLSRAVRLDTERANKQIAYLAERTEAGRAGQGEVEESLRYQSHGPEFERNPRAVLQLAATCWYESSLNLREMCAARGIYYVHALQPALDDPGAKVKVGKESGLTGPPGWKQGVLEGYPLLRERGAQLLDRGVVFVDATKVFADARQVLYYDPCHFVEAGNRLLASVIASTFLEHLPSK